MEQRWTCDGDASEEERNFIEGFPKDKEWLFIKKEGNESGGYGNVVEVFDWSGKKVKTINLDHFLGGGRDHVV